MATWPKINKAREDGTQVEMQAPLIVSASRSTDVPAFYSDWFFHRLRVGYSAWVNPFNGVKSFVSYDNTRFIVFWSKNPRPLLPHLDYLRERGIGCYVQFTLNDYESEHLERGVPPLANRIETFKMLSKELGRDAVIWRFDPLMLTADIDADSLLGKIERIGDQIHSFTRRLVFSFADIAPYARVKSNLEANRVPYIEWTTDLMTDFASRLVELNERKGWGLTLATCGEKGDYPGVVHNHCVDDELIIRLAHKDKELMKFLKVNIQRMPAPDLFGNVEPIPTDAILLDDSTYATRGDNRDKGQRDFCGCMKSKDIGQYNTCPHLCEYCYANTSKQSAMANYKVHMVNALAETITGK